MRIDTKEFSENTIEIIKEQAVIDLLFEYEVHCYNDSTSNNLFKYGGYYNLEPQLLVLNSDGSLTVIKNPLYAHKKPTFEGFLEWLHERDNTKGYISMHGKVRGINTTLFD